MERITVDEQNKIKAEGAAAYTPGAKTAELYERNPYKKTVSGGCLEPRANYFFQGWHEAQEKWEKARLEPFMTELRALCQKHDAFINLGCGCCGGGFGIHNVTENELFEHVNSKEV